jgi:hypothetical protein
VHAADTARTTPADPAPPAPAAAAPAPAATVRADAATAERAIRCAAVAADDARLACYDDVFREKRAPEAVFGLERKEARPAETLATVRGRITDVQTLRDGALVVTLENGQVWRQLDEKGSARWRVGQELVIERASMGSFLAAQADSRRYFRVRRER